MSRNNCDMIVKDALDSCEDTACVLEPLHVGVCVDRQGNTRDNQINMPPRPGIINWARIERDIKLGVF